MLTRSLCKNGRPLPLPINSPIRYQHKRNYHPELIKFRTGPRAGQIPDMSDARDPSEQPPVATTVATYFEGFAEQLSSGVCPPGSLASIGAFRRCSSSIAASKG